MQTEKKVHVKGKIFNGSCLHCKTKQEMAPRITDDTESFILLQKDTNKKKGVPFLLGSCPQCKKKMSRIISKKDLEDHIENIEEV